MIFTIKIFNLTKRSAMILDLEVKGNFKKLICIDPIEKPEATNLENSKL